MEWDFFMYALVHNDFEVREFKIKLKFKFKVVIAISTV